MKNRTCENNIITEPHLRKTRKIVKSRSRERNPKSKFSKVG